MESEFPRVRLGDICKLRSGYPFKSADWTETGEPVIKIANVKAGRILPEGCAFVSPSVARQASEWYTQPGDILIAMTGYVGELAWVRPGERYLINQRVGRFERLDTKKVIPRYLFYALQHPEIRTLIETIARGSAQPNLSAGDAHGIEIPFPPIQTQRQIEETLSALDNKIALLRETNATLEAIAQAIFKSWFVDFDPVRAKAEGRDPEGVPPEVADLFPNEFEDSELGAIPKGWRAMPFTGAIDVIGGGTPKTSVEAYWNGDIPWFSVVDAPRDGDVFVLDTEKHITADGVANSSTRMLRSGTTIISARGTVGKTALVGREMAMNQSCYGLQGRLIGDAQTYFATRRLVSDLRQRSHGSVFETITRDTLKSVSVVVAPPKISDAFESFVGMLLGRVKNNVSEAGTLTDLRDTLLPRLMSGKFRLPETEHQLGEHR